jgi:hypothetical protein
VRWNRVRLSLPWITRGIGAPCGALDALVRVKSPNWTNQQAPGFWAQKSSNCWAFEPAGGAVSFVGLSAVPVLGAEEPPLPLSPVAVPVSVLVPLDEVLPVLVELSGVAVLEVPSLLVDLLSLFADAAAEGA